MIFPSTDVSPILSVWITFYLKCIKAEMQLSWKKLLVFLTHSEIVIIYGLVALFKVKNFVDPMEKLSLCVKNPIVQLCSAII